MVGSKKKEEETVGDMRQPSVDGLNSPSNPNVATAGTTAAVKQGMCIGLVLK